MLPAVGVIYAALTDLSAPGSTLSAAIEGFENHNYPGRGGGRAASQTTACSLARQNIVNRRREPSGDLPKAP
jgi:hypothetical protein